MPMPQHPQKASAKLVIPHQSTKEKIKKHKLFFIIHAILRSFDLDKGTLVRKNLQIFWFFPYSIVPLHPISD